MSANNIKPQSGDRGMIVNVNNGGISGRRPLKVAKTTANAAGRRS
ncbi:MAG: hypothetical protein ACTS45_01595 [Candidatus Hodgkinia cicadicola]